MPKKQTTPSEPIVSSGAAPARSRKHTPAKRTAAAAADPSSSIVPTGLIVTDANTNPSDANLASKEIARLAYSYWESRGYQGGTPEEDWLRAEQELNSRLVSAS